VKSSLNRAVHWGYAAPYQSLLLTYSLLLFALTGRTLSWQMRSIVASLLVVSAASLAVAQIDLFDGDLGIATEIDDCSFRGHTIWDVITTTLDIYQVVPEQQNLNSPKRLQVNLCEPVRAPFGCEQTAPGYIIEMAAGSSFAPTTCEVTFTTPVSSDGWLQKYGGANRVFAGTFTNPGDRVANVTLVCDPQAHTLAPTGDMVAHSSQGGSVWTFDIRLITSAICDGNTTMPPQPNTTSAPSNGTTTWAPITSTVAPATTPAPGNHSTAAPNTTAAPNQTTTWAPITSTTAPVVTTSVPGHNSSTAAPNTTTAPNSTSTWAPIVPTTAPVPTTTTAPNTTSGPNTTVAPSTWAPHTSTVAPATPSPPTPAPVIPADANILFLATFVSGLYDKELFLTELTLWLNASASSVTVTYTAPYNDTTNQAAFFFDPINGGYALAAERAHMLLGLSSGDLVNDFDIVALSATAMPIPLKNLEFTAQVDADIFSRDIFVMRLGLWLADPDIAVIIDSAPGRTLVHPAASNFARRRVASQEGGVGTVTFHFNGTNATIRAHEFAAYADDASELARFDILNLTFAPLTPATPTPAPPTAAPPTPAPTTNLRPPIPSWLNITFQAWFTNASTAAALPQALASWLAAQPEFNQVSISASPIDGGFPIRLW
jgi:hypothetical protein